MEVDCKCWWWIPVVKDVDGGRARGWRQVV